MKKNKQSKELIKNVNIVCDWIYQRKEFDYGLIVRFFNEFLSVLQDVSSDENMNTEYLAHYQKMFTRLTSAYEERDLILTADIMCHEFAEALLLGRIYTPEIIDSGVASDDYFNANRMAMQERYGIDLKSCQADIFMFSTGEAKDGSRILYIEENKNVIRMNSLYDPTHEAMRWADKYGSLSNVKTTIAINGLLNGYFFRALRLTVRNNVNFIIYEPSMPLFLYVCKHFNLVDIIQDERVNLVIPVMPEDTFFQVLSNSTSRVKTNIFGIITPGYIKDEKFSVACEQVNLMDEMDRGYREHMGKEAFQNELFAFTHLHNNYLVSDLFKVLPRSVPVFIVSGGPSLLKNITELQRVKGKGLIVAVDRAVSVLIKHGILPDIMVTIDPTKDPGFLDYKEAKDLYLMCGFSANRTVMKRHNEKLIMIHSDVRYNEIPGLDGRLMSFGDVGGGVATAAFLHFVYMNIDNIILVGQDLAYERNGLTHADGIDNTGGKIPDIEVDGINGGKVTTTWDYNRALEFFERKIREYPTSNVIDATEGGALIQGTQVRTLKETVDELCTKNLHIDLMLGSMPKAQTLEQHKETITYMRNRIAELKKIKELCVDLCEITHRLITICRYGNVGDKNAKKKISKYNEFRNRIYPMRANDWLEEIWVTDRYTVPDPYIVVRTNDEALPVFEEAYKYYQLLPKYCDSLSDVIEKELT